MTTPVCAILAGGESRRMGRNKALISLDGMRLIDHVIARLLPQAGEIVIAGPDDFGTGLPLVPDLPEGPRGPVAGVVALAAMLSRRGDETARYVTLPVDGPFFPGDLVARLTAGAGMSYATCTAHPHPTFACWCAARVVERIRPAGETMSLRAALRHCAARPVPFADSDSFMNINSSGDLEIARKICRERR